MSTEAIHLVMFRPQERVRWWEWDEIIMWIHGIFKSWKISPDLPYWGFHGDMSNPQSMVWGHGILPANYGAPISIGAWCFNGDPWGSRGRAHSAALGDLPAHVWHRLTTRGYKQLVETCWQPTWLEDHLWPKGIAIIMLLLGGLEHGFYDFPYIGNSNPNWRTHIFQRGRSTTNQATSAVFFGCTCEWGIRMDTDLAAQWFCDFRTLDE